MKNQSVLRRRNQKKCQFSIYIKKDVRLKTDKLAIEQMVSRGTIIELALEEYFKLFPEVLKDVA